MGLSELLPKRRWVLVKFSLLSGKDIPVPDLRREYWMARSAVRERNRLNHILVSSGFPQRYRVERAD